MNHMIRSTDFLFCETCLVYVDDDWYWYPTTRLDPKYPNAVPAPHCSECDSLLKQKINLVDAPAEVHA